MNDEYEAEQRARRERDLRKGATGLELVLHAGMKLMARGPIYYEREGVRYAVDIGDALVEIAVKSGSAVVEIKRR